MIQIPLKSQKVEIFFSFSPFLTSTGIQGKSSGKGLTTLDQIVRPLLTQSNMQGVSPSSTVIRRRPSNKF